MKKIQNIVIGIVVLILFIGFGIKTSSPMPDNAILFVDNHNRIYYSPPYVRDYMIDTSSLVTVRRSDIKGKGYKPDDKCRKNGYFSSDDLSSIIVYQVKEMLGMNKKRLNSDGTWNW